MTVMGDPDYPVAITIDKIFEPLQVMYLGEIHTNGAEYFLTYQCRLGGNDFVFQLSLLVGRT